MQRNQIILDFYNTVYQHIFSTSGDPEKWNEVAAGIETIVAEYQKKLESLFQLAEAELANQITVDLDLLPMMFTPGIIEKIYQINASSLSGKNTIIALEELYAVPAIAVEENWKMRMEDLLLQHLIKQSRDQETRYYPNIQRILQLCKNLINEPSGLVTTLRVIKLLNNLFPKVINGNKAIVVMLLKQLESQSISREDKEYQREIFIARQFCQQGPASTQAKEARFYQLSCQLITQLTAYIDRVHSHTLADGSVDYAFGFMCIGRHKRAQNRMANTKLAIDLVRQIQELQDNFDPANAKQALKDLRAIFDKQQLLTVRSRVMPEATRGINSKELNFILKSIR